MVKGNVFRGASYVLRGLSILKRPEIRAFVWVPLLSNALLFTGVIIWGAGRFSAFIEQTIPGWLSPLSWLLWPIFALIVSVVVFLTFIHLGNLLAAPFNVLLSQKIETLIRGKKEESAFVFSVFLLSIGPAVASECQKLIYFLIRAIPILLLFFVPVLNVIAPFLWIIVSAWFLTIEYLDYPMGNHDILFDEQRKVLKTHRLTAMGFGLSLFVLLMIPVLNFIAMPAAVAGATLMWVEELDD